LDEGRAFGLQRLKWYHWYVGGGDLPDWSFARLKEFWLSPVTFIIAGCCEWFDNSGTGLPRWYWKMAVKTSIVVLFTSMPI